MEEMQDFIADMTATAWRNWMAGIETPLFPIHKDSVPYRANIMWNMALNSMAYGYERGLEQGYQLAKTESN